jgi:putative hydrolase of the HAD superfamily
MHLQAVLFDLWGTLVLDPPERSLPRQGWRAQRVREALASHNCLGELDPIAAALNEAARALTALQDKGVDLMAGGRAALFAELFELKGGPPVPRSALPQVEEAIGAMPEAYQPVEAPLACQTLAAIKASGLATALVSNAGLTTSPHLRRLLRDYEMLPHLDYLVFSDELGIAKPHARMFGEALNGIGVPAKACAFVGDSPHNDIGGAKSAGLFAIQIGSRHIEGITPDAHIQMLEELLPALQMRERTAGLHAG